MNTATPETFAATMDALEQTALRVKAERDAAVKLLRECLLYSICGQHGPFKSRVRALLAAIDGVAAPAPADPQTDEFLRRWRAFATVRGIE